jgi:hypothetical protein
MFFPFTLTIQSPIERSSGLLWRFNRQLNAYPVYFDDSIAN